MTTAPSETDAFASAADGDPDGSLVGERIVLVGRLSGMVRRDAQQLIREHGGTVAEQIDQCTTLVVLGDDSPEPAVWLQKDDLFDETARAAVDTGRLRVVRESELWERIGLVDSDSDARRLYTTAMLADLVGVPASAVRRWHRRGILQSARQVRQLAFFDFTEVTVARRLAELVAGGCSLHVIERKLDELSRQMPELTRPLAELPLVVEGKRLLVRRGDDLSEPGGQLLLDFETAETCDEAASPPVESPVAISIETARSRLHRPPDDRANMPTAEELLAAAIEMENDGELLASAELYRAVLVAGPTAEACFLLADVLYRLGDLSAARERYYAAIELDETFVEARANLGCLLAEMGEPELAVAALEGALALQPDYPDVHYHLARTLDALAQHAKAEAHWQTFLDLSPDSPWAEEAEARLSTAAREE